MRKRSALLAAAILSAAAALPASADGLAEETEKNAKEQVLAEQAKDPGTGPAIQIDGLRYEGKIDLQYADQFQIYRYEDGYRLISIINDANYLVVPENMEVPEGLDKDVTVLRQPLDSIYLAATSPMDFFDTLDCVGLVTLSGQNESGWYSGKAKTSMAAGDMVYAGKYSEPDYETILAGGCDLAIESTMIYHKPEVKEKLEKLGIPVMVEHSSYETDPLGRSEWIKLYGVLAGKEKEADRAFAGMEQKADSILENIGEAQDSHFSTAFFSINSNGSATVYKTQGYVPKMIGMAGGQYVFQDLGDDSALSTVNMQMEEFYAGAKDADFLVYNSTIEGEIHSMSELLEKSPMLKDFRAVQDGHVWCTSVWLFQKPTGIADFIADLYNMYQGNKDADYTYLHHVDG